MSRHLKYLCLSAMSVSHSQMASVAVVCCSEQGAQLLPLLTQLHVSAKDKPPPACEVI
jgi:hypothetical protein